MHDTDLDDAPWLDDQEMRIWRAFLSATGHIASQLSDSLKEQGGLTMDDYEVLVHLSESEEQRLRMTELSVRLLNSQSRLSQRVDRLEKRGLVSREKCTQDGRGTFACLTTGGLQTIRDIAPHHVRDVRRLLIDVIKPSERQILGDVLERVAAAASNVEAE